MQRALRDSIGNRPHLSAKMTVFQPFLANFPSSTQCPFLEIFVQNLFFIQKAVNLSSKSLLALTKQVSTCFEDFMKIS